MRLETRDRKAKLAGKAHETESLHTWYYNFIGFSEWCQNYCAGACVEYFPLLQAQEVCRFSLTKYETKYELVAHILAKLLQLHAHDAWTVLSALTKSFVGLFANSPA
jgi:hypothetical protein